MIDVPWTWPTDPATAPRAPAQAASRTPAPDPPRLRRTHVEPEDPPWLRVAFSHPAIADRLVTSSVLAAALGRSSRTIRRWEHAGLLPRAPYLGPRTGFGGRVRLYPVHDVIAWRDLADRHGLLDRRTDMPPAGFAADCRRARQQALPAPPGGRPPGRPGRAA